MTEASAPAPIGASISDGTGPAVPLVSDAYRRYALVVLMLVYTLNFLDRQIVTILAEPIKNDLGLADWQLGLMTGLAFAVFYTVLGLPIARLAESFNRVWIIGGSLGYTRQDTRLPGNRGGLDTHGWSVSAYTTYYQADSWYMDGVLTYGQNDYELLRQISYTLPLALQMFISAEGGSEWGIAMAVAMFTTLPPLILYLFTQKFILSTFMQSGMKG